MTHLPLEPRPGNYPPTSPAAPTAAGSPAPDPGSRRAAFISWLIVIVCAIAVVIFQQRGVSSKTAAAQAAPEPDAPLVGEFDQAVIVSKFVVKIGQYKPELRPQFSMYLADSDTMAPEQTLAIVPAVAELLGKDAALERLDTIEARPASRDFQTDIDQLRTLYESGPDALDPSIRTRISKRFGWSGDLGLTSGKPDTDPVRAALLGGGEALFIGLALAGALLCFGFFGGLVLLALFFISVATGKIKPRLIRPGAGGSVGIETAAVFIACFLGLKVLAEEVLPIVMLGNKTGPALAEAQGQLQIITLAIQWIILPVVLLWPTLRKLRQPEARRALGLHSGSGVFSEIGVGIIGYIASVPVFIGGALISVILMFVWQAIQQTMGVPPAKGPVNPLLDYFAQSPAFVLLLASLAVIWAPITEELVFRGGMLRQLHTRMNIIPASILTAIAFALMHGYPIIMMGSILGLAVSFAMLRWWRGSLISCITAHCMHNAIVSLLLFSLVKALG